MAGNFHLDYISGFGPTPDRVRSSALEHHVVAEHRADEWQDRIISRRGGEPGGKSAKAKAKVFELHIPMMSILKNPTIFFGGKHRRK
jgi:hypothetical protein